MAGRKRAATDDEGANTRAAKTAKTTKTPAKGGKKGPKAIAASAFKARALPLHVNVTHTPPVIPDETTENAATADPGTLGGLTLVPTSFSTGSYGWKGSKHISVELDDPEGGEGKEKVHVILTVNATVVGSKSAEKDGAEAEPEAVEAKEAAEETKDAEKEEAKDTEQEETKEAEAAEE